MYELVNFVSQLDFMYSSHKNEWDAEVSEIKIWNIAPGKKKAHIKERKSETRFY